VAALVLAALVLTADPAGAHARLVSSDPGEGQVLPVAPGAATFAFNEPVRSVPDGVQLFDARGSEVVVSARTRDARLVVDLPEELDRGTYVVAWRVVSDDGHPIAGTLTFSVGAPSAASAAPASLQLSSPPEVAGLLAVAQAAAYLGIFGACGLALFVVLLLPRAGGLEEVRDRVLAIARPGALLTLVAGGAVPPLSALSQRGLGLDALGQSGLWTDVLSSTETASWFLAALGTAVAVYFARGGQTRTPDRVIVLVSVLAALGSLSLVGHTRSEEPLWLMVTADLSHVAAAAVWLGGLIGLVVALRRLAARPRAAAELLGRFSALAAWLLVGVAVTGTLMGQRILGSWDNLLHTAFGQALLVKVALVALVVVVAGWNRYGLMPAVLATRADTRRAAAAAHWLQRAVRAEAVLLVAVLLLTGYLVDRSPARAAPAVEASGATYQGRTGAATVIAVVEPVRIGKNSVLLHLRDSDGKTVDPVAAPTVSASLGDLALSPRRSTKVAPATYRLTLVLPRSGTWNLQVSVRLSRFENPVVGIDIPVPTTP